MLSYRHAYHAGNHADVLKHLVLVELLSYLSEKDKRFWYIDTHAGAGMYALDSAPASAQREYDDGIGRLWKAAGLSLGLETYVDLVRQANSGETLQRYPGSPWFARELTRAEDRIWLSELHPRDHDELCTQLGSGDSRIRIAKTDGFTELKRLLPPEPRRALVMIDPSYELLTDYQQLVDGLRDSLRRFATGVYAIWYPMLRSREARQLPAQLRAVGATRWLDVSIRVCKSVEDSAGLFGSGMFVINPPFKLAAALHDSMPHLVRLLGRDESATYELEQEAA